MKKAMLIAIAALTVTCGGVALARDISARNHQAPAASAQRQTTFAIENMTCALCPATVKKAMAGVVGVSAVSVDFAAKTARATYDPSRTNAAQIAAASTNAGYPARAVRN